MIFKEQKMPADSNFLSLDYLAQRESFLRKSLRPGKKGSSNEREALRKKLLMLSVSSGSPSSHEGERA